MHQLPSTLAQITPEHRNSVLLALGILLVVVIIGGIAILIFRRHVTGQSPTDRPSDGGFLLSDLRKMRDNGEITPEEYERTRARVVAKLKETANEPRPPKSNSPDADNAN
jgi:hypothetical protein